MLRFLVFAIGCVLAACGSSVTPADTAGTWTGTWKNTTFGSTGSGRLTITVDEQTKGVEYKLDLDGGVFGAGDPPEETFSGSYASGEFKMSGESETFGQTTITVDADGRLTGTAKPSRGSVTLTGNVTASRITIDYSIDDGGPDPITGKVEFTK